MAEPTNPYVKCRRCRAPYDRRIITASRFAVARDVYICPTCGELEATRDLLGWPPMPPDGWPVDPEELGREYAALSRRRQHSTLRILGSDELDTGGEA